jgi:hypothetical protein
MYFLLYFVSGFSDRLVVGVVSKIDETGKGNEMSIKIYVTGYSTNFRTLDLWKIVTAPYYFRYQDRHGCEEALRALRFRCDRGAKQFSQRAQRLSG